MKLILVTGMSGAGKSVALKTLEDCGFEAIDNIPLAFLPAVASSGTKGRNLAVGADVRSRDFSAEHFLEAIEAIKNNPDIDFKIVFLDCDDETLQRRFTETRRRHPLALDRTVMDGLKLERRQVFPLRDVSDLVIDTTEYGAAELRQVIASHFAREERSLTVAVTSFSFKRGVPRDADMVFDVRFLLNPYWDEALRTLNGLDNRVVAHVEADKDYGSFFDHLTGLLLPLLPRYLEEGKHYLTIAIGCTGGQHRSVHIAHKLTGFLQSKGYNVTEKHRDMVC